MVKIFRGKRRHFLVGFELGAPNWEQFDFPHFKDDPSVQWKLQNLRKLGKQNPSKMLTEANKLKAVFDR